MKLTVPYFSQLTHVKDPSWQPKACGVTSAAMVISYIRPGLSISIDDLIAEGVFINGYEKAGWRHDALVTLIRNHGMHAYRQEFKSRMFDVAKSSMGVSSHEEILTENGIKKITQTIQGGMPVIASVIGNFRDGGEPHLIPLIGVSKGEQSGFYYHEPNATSEREGAYQFVDSKTFRKHWRKMAIFVSPSNFSK